MTALSRTSTRTSWFKSTLFFALALGLGLGSGYLYRNNPLIGPGSSKSGSQPGPTVRRGDFSAIHAAAGGSVVMYSLSSCASCKQAKILLEAQGVPYVERQLDHSESLKREAKALGAKQVPLILIGNASIEGYDEKKILGLLWEHGLVRR